MKDLKPDSKKDQDPQETFDDLLQEPSIILATEDDLKEQNLDN